MRKLFFAVAGLFFTCLQPLQAQKISLLGEAGLQHSWIPDYSDQKSLEFCPPTSGFCSIVSTADVAYVYKEKPGAYLKLALHYAVKERLRLYHQLTINLLRFQPQTKLAVGSLSAGVQGITENNKQYFSQGQAFGTYDQDAFRNNCVDEQGNPVSCRIELPAVFSDEKLGKTSVLYVGQEMGAAYQLLPRFALNGGVDISYRVYSQVYVPRINFSQMPANGSWMDPVLPAFTYSIEKDKSGSNLNSVLLGLHMGAAYEVFSGFALSLAVQHALTPVVEANSMAGKKAKPNLLRLGVQYTLKQW